MISYQFHKTTIGFLIIYYFKLVHSYSYCFPNITLNYKRCLNLLFYRFWIKIKFPKWTKSVRRKLCRAWWNYGRARVIDLMQYGLMCRLYTIPLKDVSIGKYIYFILLDGVSIYQISNHYRMVIVKILCVFL